MGRFRNMPLASTRGSRRRWPRFLCAAAGGLALAYLVLLFPEREVPPPAGAGRQPFAWRQDSFWAELRQELLSARRTDPSALSNRIQAASTEIRVLLDKLQATAFPAEAVIFTSLETNLFRLAPLVAAAPAQVPEFIALANRTRKEVKDQSARWDLGSATVRQRLYRLLYGTRMALEEVLLQMPQNISPSPTLIGENEPSQTPAARILGVEIHSGDILVSRGGAATSALISRGNDFPGNFSHVGLAHIDETTGRVSIIESLSQCGVVITPVEHYLQDKKLRLLVLRLRADLPALVANPRLPHRAAASALAEAQARHIPYDFALDSGDHRKQFCSEVASAAYDAEGVKLWMGMTFISSPGVAAWLASLGVRHFETREPADLEYDPQLRVVAEWRHPAGLVKAHLDDAVTDAMLETALPGQGLPFTHALLPLARLVKMYSLALNLAGKVGPIPEGMSATTSLRVAAYRKRHSLIAERAAKLSGEFARQNRRPPLYWELIQLGRQAQRELN
jgi:hypothetical protein